jgi:LPS O-antigen subunit length determinant protein (WzzB/FepE family)
MSTNPKEDLMAACIKGGLTEEVCRKKMLDAFPIAQTDEDLRRKNEMLQAQVDTREKQLKQAIDIANRANDEHKARDEAEKAKLIDSIMMDSKFSKEDLTSKSIGDLQTMRITLDRSIEKTFASVAADIEASNRIKQPSLTVGRYDSASKTWIGGL